MKQDCLDILERILAEREQSKANLYGPLNKSKAELLQREMNNADLGIHIAPNDSISNVPGELSEPRSPVKKEPSEIKMSGYLGKVNSSAGKLNEVSREPTEHNNQRQEHEKTASAAAADLASDNASYLN